MKRLGNGFGDVQEVAAPTLATAIGAVLKRKRNKKDTAVEDESPSKKIDIEGDMEDENEVPVKREAEDGDTDLDTVKAEEA